MGVRFHEYDVRSRRNIITSSRSIAPCREAVDRLVGEGYGLNIVPELDLLPPGSRASWLEILGDIFEEMLRRGHEVLVVGEDPDEDLKSLELEMLRRGLELPRISCRQARG